MIPGISPTSARANRIRGYSNLLECNVFLIVEALLPFAHFDVIRGHTELLPPRFRESIYRLLPQTTPENVSKNFSQYSLDPTTRYPNISLNFIKPSQVSGPVCMWLVVFHSPLCLLNLLCVADEAPV